MAFNHKFLATKSWHVLNSANQQAVAAAEANQASLQKRVDERKRTLERERTRQQSLALMNEGSTRGSGGSGQATSVAFLYEPPPGFIPALAAPRVMQEPSIDELAEVHDLTKLETKPLQSRAVASQQTREALPLNAPPTLLPSADGSLPAAAVESHEDRRARHRGMSVQAIREELHPALRGAPVTAPHVRGMTFTAKPLGVMLRDTRCMRCGGIGHSSTDRECPRFNDNTTAADQSRLVREDPLTKLHAQAHEQQQQQLANASSPASSFGQPSGTGSGVAGGKKGQFKLVYNDEAYTVGGFGADHPLQQVLLDSGSDDEEKHKERAIQAELEAVKRKRERKRVKTEPSSASNHSAAHASTPSAGHAAAPAISSSSSVAAAGGGSLTADEIAFYSSLPADDMRLLLKQLKKARDVADSSSKRSKRSKESKRTRKSKSSSSSKRSRRSPSPTSKRNKRKHRSSSSSSSSSSDSSSDSSSSSSSSSSEEDDHKSRSTSRQPPRSVKQKSYLSTASSSQTPLSQLTVAPSSSVATTVAVAAPVVPAPVAPVDDFDQPPPLEFAAAPADLLATLTQPALHATHR